MSVSYQQRTYALQQKSLHAPRGYCSRADARSRTKGDLEKIKIIGDDACRNLSRPGARRWRIATGPPIITTWQSWEVGMMKRRIGILTGGGDVPGLNAVIKSVTYRGSENDIEVAVVGRPSRT
jgi:hypothetical protein